MKHTIILNPIDSLIKISGSVTSRQRIFSSPEYCQAALDGMSLTSNATDIITFLRNHTSTFKTAIVTGYEATIVRIISNHFNIPCLDVLGSSQNKTLQYQHALDITGTTADDALVLSGYKTDIQEANLAGIVGFLYGNPQGGVCSLDDLLNHIGIKKQPSA